MLQDTNVPYKCTARPTCPAGLTPANYFVVIRDEKQPQTLIIGGDSVPRDKDKPVILYEVGMKDFRLTSEPVAQISAEQFEEWFKYPAYGSTTHPAATEPPLAE